ncbi:hypothetical protein J6590_013259, partial [Homalodisca vitripennis]
VPEISYRQLFVHKDSIFQPPEPTEPAAQLTQVRTVQPPESPLHGDITARVTSAECGFSEVTAVSDLCSTGQGRPRRPTINPRRSWWSRNGKCREKRKTGRIASEIEQLV